MLLEYLCKSKVTPSVVNWFNWSWAVFVPPPNVIFLNPSGVYSVINLSCVWIYLPTLIPGWSETLVGSSIKTLSSAKASTSYHLFDKPKNSAVVGIFVYSVPLFNNTLVIPSTFFSGKNNSKNGLTSFAPITLLNTLVIPLTTISRFVIV